MNLRIKIAKLEALQSRKEESRLEKEESRLERVTRLYRAAHEKYSALPLEQTPKHWQRIQEILATAQGRKELTR